jgi:hypothetical protein
MTATQYSRAIIATTNIVRNTVLTVEALESAAKLINEGERKVVVVAEHDHNCPPLGMTVTGRVVEIADGHCGLEVISALYGPPVCVDLPNGDSGFLQALPEYPHSLTSSDFGDSKLPEIQIDPSNFGGFEDTSVFLEEIRKIAPELEYETGVMERRSLMPDPEVVFRLGLSLSASWFAARMSKAAADAIEPQLKRFFDVVMATVLKTVGAPSPRRPHCRAVEGDG